MSNALFKSRRRGSDHGIENDLLQRLRQTSRLSLELLELWLKQTQDHDVKSGLESQIRDERRRVHILTDELRRRSQPVREEDKLALSRIFSEIGKLETDLQKLCAYHRGVKAFTLNRCSRLLGYLDPQASVLVEELMQEAERHIRWADIRVARMMTHASMRECNLLMSKHEKNLMILWERSARGLNTRPAGPPPATLGA